MTDLGRNFEPFSASGQWWLPDRDNERVGGTLDFDATGKIRLNVITALDRDRASSLLIRYPVVMGRTVQGDDVTLCGTVSLERHLGEFSFGREGEVIAAETLFIGTHLDSGIDTKFDQVVIELENLNSWMATEVLAKPETSSDGNRKLLLSHAVDLTVSAPIGDIQMYSDMSETFSIHSVELERQSLIVVKLERVMTDSQILDDVVRPLQYFFTLACDAPCQVSDLSYRHASFPISDRIPYPKRIGVVHSGDRVRSSETVYDSMLFSLRDIATHPQSVFDEWFQLIKTIRPSLNLIYGLKLGSQTYLETTFLLLAQAAEVYSRLRFPDQQKRSQDHKMRRSRILSSMNDHADFEWLKEALHFYHEPTFAERIEGLRTHAGPHSFDITGLSFAEDLKHTRNYFTHYDDKSHKRAITEPSKLNRLAEQTALLLAMCFLRDLGFDEWASWKHLSGTMRRRGLL